MEWCEAESHLTLKGPIIPFVKQVKYVCVMFGENCM